MGNNPVNFADPSGMQGGAVVAGTVVTVSCTAGAAGSVGTACVVGVVAATGIVVYYTCVVGEACEGLGGAIVGGGRALVEGAGDVVGEVVGEVGGLLEKPKPPIIIRYTDEDPFPVFYPTTSQLLPPEWKCWGRYPPWVCLAIGGGAIAVGAGRTLDFWQQFLNPIDRILGEKMGGR